MRREIQINEFNELQFPIEGGYSEKEAMCHKCMCHGELKAIPIRSEGRFIGFSFICEYCLKNLRASLDKTKKV